MHQRHKKILDMLQHGRISLPAAAAELGVTTMTLRRDFKELEKQKLLLQVKNGAIPHPACYEPAALPDDDRDLKFALANRLYELIMPADSLFISTGTTALAFAKVLARRNKAQLTVITNALPVASALFQSSCKVILLGGELRSNSLDLVGPAAEKNLAQYRVNWLISGCDAALGDYGFYTSDVSLAQLEQHSISIAEHAAVITTSEKFRKRALTRFAALGDIDLLVTDSNLAPEQLELLQISDIQIEQVPVLPQ